MRVKCSIIFISLLLLLGAVPRVHCLCHHYDVLVVSASSLDCCKGDASHNDAPSLGTMQGDSCFIGAQPGDKVGCSAFNMPPVAAVIVPILLPLSKSASNTADTPIIALTRAPPPRHPPGVALHVFNCVLLS